MSIINNDISELFDALDGRPYVTGDYHVTRSENGFQCKHREIDSVSILLPPDMTLLGVTRFVSIFDAGFKAGVAKTSEIMRDLEVAL